MSLASALTGPQAMARDERRVAAKTMPKVREPKAATIGGATASSVKAPQVKHYSNPPKSQWFGTKVKCIECIKHYTGCEWEAELVAVRRATADRCRDG